MKYKVAAFCCVVGLSCVAWGGVKWMQQKPSNNPGAIEVVKDTISVELGPDVPLNVPTRVEFELRNTGDSNVQIGDVSSSCGCATPEVEPKVIEKGKTAKVYVEAMPAAGGEKSALISVSTDSPVTPVISLKFRLFAARKPPFMLRFAGDLTFNGDVTIGDSREISVITIEEIGKKTAPSLRHNINFLQIEEPTTKTKPYFLPGTVSNTFTYNAKVVSPPPDELYSGEVLIVDPWEKDRIEQVRFISEPTPKLRAVPSVLLVSRSKQVSNNDKYFTVISREPIGEPEISVQGKSQEQIKVSIEEITSDRKRLRCRVNLLSATSEDDQVVHIAVKVNKMSKNEVIVPVNFVQ